MGKECKCNKCYWLGHCIKAYSVSKCRLYKNSIVPLNEEDYGDWRCVYIRSRSSERRLSWMLLQEELSSCEQRNYMYWLPKKRNVMYICMCCGKDYTERIGKCIACGSSELEDLDEEKGKLLQEQIDRPYEEWSEYEWLSWVVIATHFMGTAW